MAVLPKNKHHLPVGFDMSKGKHFKDGGRGRNVNSGCELEGFSFSLFQVHLLLPSQPLVTQHESGRYLGTSYRSVDFVVAKFFLLSRRKELIVGHYYYYCRHVLSISFSFLSGSIAFLTQ